MIHQTSGSKSISGETYDYRGLMLCGRNLALDARCIISTFICRLVGCK